MPKVLIVAATIFEVEPLCRKFNIDLTEQTGLFQSKSDSTVSILITGVGMVNTAFYMGKHNLANYDYIINVGIAGAFDREIEIGEVVNVTSDTISELGAEDGNGFIKYVGLGLKGTNVFHNDKFPENGLVPQLKKVSAITVNTVHGNETSIKKVMELYKPEIESMEGAAFLMACSNAGAKCSQIRAVSNYVEKRDKSKWDIPLAIKNLNDVVLKIIQSL